MQCLGPRQPPRGHEAAAGRQTNTVAALGASTGNRTTQQPPNSGLGLCETEALAQLLDGVSVIARTGRGRKKAPGRVADELLPRHSSSSVLKAPAALPLALRGPNASSVHIPWDPGSSQSPGPTPVPRDRTCISTRSPGGLDVSFQKH